jgi:KUP system potassium uptake protein
MFMRPILDRTVFMVFWTWAKGLEDQFDGVNRRNLRHIISMEATEDALSPPAESPQSTDKTIEFDITISNPETLDVTDKQGPQTEKRLQFFLDGGGEKIHLPRVSTMAVFHKIATGKGIPHTFYGFLKQWPTLPRVVVSLLSFNNLIDDRDTEFLEDLLVCSHRPNGACSPRRTLSHHESPDSTW